MLVGYGLTETSPVLCSRQVDRNVLGTVGKPLPNTQLRIKDLSNKREIKTGEPGVLWVKGPGVMQGYFKEEPNAKVFDRYVTSKDRLCSHI
jgi:long-chain acyl-CoA synthetase